MSLVYRDLLGRELMGLARALDSIRSFADTKQGNASVSDAQRACRMIAATIGLVSDELTHLGSTLAKAPVSGEESVDDLGRRFLPATENGRFARAEHLEVLEPRTDAPIGTADGPPLDRERFATTVREALRLCDRPDLLNMSPLCASRWVTRRAKDGEATVDGRALSSFLRDECRRLFASPRDQILDRVMERTFFHPACKREAIAAELGLTYSTYRRYLAQAVTRLVDALYLQIHA